MSASLLILTRYLYVKEEVAISIINSMLELDPVAIFWAYELYHSGFQEETFEIIFKTYYYLFASLNPDVESFLHEKLAEWRTAPETNAYVINDIMQTLLIRPYDTDVFLLHRMAVYLDYDADVSSLTATSSNTDAAAYFVAHPDLGDCHVFPALNPIVSISRRIASQNKKRKCLPLYMKTKPSDAQQYETRNISPPYMTLKTMCVPLDPHHYLALYDISRRNSAMALQIYHQCWLVCASYSPIWMARIEAHGGSIVSNKVVFSTEDGEETFYEKYGYEPDEQPVEVQRRNMPPIIQGKTWLEIVRKGVFPANEWESEMIGNL